MENNIVNFNDMKKLYDLKEKYDAGLVDEDDMTVDEIKGLTKLYLDEPRELEKEYTRKLIQKSKENNYD